MSNIPRPCVSNEKVAESTVELMNAVVRKTPLKPRPEKPIRKGKSSMVKKERISNEMSGAKDFHQASNSLRQDIYDDCSFSDNEEQLGAKAQVITKLIEELDAQVNTMPIEELYDQANLMSEFGAQVNMKPIRELGDQVNNSESNVEEHSSLVCEVIEELSDSPPIEGMVSNPESIVHLEMSKPSANLILCLLEEELAKKGSAIHRHLVAARDVVQESLAIPSPLEEYDLANRGEFPKVYHERCLVLLQQMADTSQRMTEMATQCKAMLTESIEENEDEYWEDNEEENEDYDENSFPTFLANFFLVAAIIFAMILPPIFYNYGVSEIPNYFHRTVMSLFGHEQD